MVTVMIVTIIVLVTVVTVLFSQPDVHIWSIDVRELELKYLPDL